MLNAIVEFEREMVERMSRVYYDELMYFSATVPDPLINFNDILLLKKCQKYVSHTNLLFQKAIGHLYSSLLSEVLHLTNKICNTDGGNGRGINVTINGTKYRVHFLGQEKFVNFPRVPWFNMKENADGYIDIYTVIISKNSQGISFIEQANRMLDSKGISTKEFILLEDYTISIFGASVWNEVEHAFKHVEQQIKQYQWFGLISYYNELTQDEYHSQMSATLCQFDYRSQLLAATSRRITDQEFKTLITEFIDKGKYKLLLGRDDFASSFVSSEWLYRELNNNDLLEKTFIVAGYIKSIEQLMSFLILNSSTRSDQIGVLSSGGIVQVDVQSPEFYRATLGNMMIYLKQYSSRHIYARGLSLTCISMISEIVRDWVSQERNGYFHKHNISDMRRVTEIRGKTYLLYFLLIASIGSIVLNDDGTL